MEANGSARVPTSTRSKSRQARGAGTESEEARAARHRERRLRRRDRCWGEGGGGGGGRGWRGGESSQSNRRGEDASSDDADAAGRNPDAPPPPRPTRGSRRRARWLNPSARRWRATGPGRWAPLRRAADARAILASLRGAPPRRRPPAPAGRAKHHARPPPRAPRPRGRHRGDAAGRAPPPFAFSCTRPTRRLRTIRRGLLSASRGARSARGRRPTRRSTLMKTIDKDLGRTGFGGTGGRRRTSRCAVAAATLAAGDGAAVLFLEDDVVPTVVWEAKLRRPAGRSSTRLRGGGGGGGGGGVGRRRKRRKRRKGGKGAGRTCTCDFDLFVAYRAGRDAQPAGHLGAFDGRTQAVLFCPRGGRGDGGACRGAARRGDRGDRGNRSHVARGAGLPPRRVRFAAEPIPHRVRGRGGAGRGGEAPERDVADPARACLGEGKEGEGEGEGSRANTG